jgi:hypothetical protein
MNRLFLLLCTVACTALTVAGCDSGKTPASGKAGAVATDSSASPSTGACGLLTGEQVNTVILGNDGGREQDASEAMLLKDVTMQHCRYFRIDGTDIQILNVIVSKASSDKAFEQIRLSTSDWASHGAKQKLEFGDVAYLEALADDDAKVSVSKGRNVLEISLSAKDAKAKSPQLIELAKTAASKL